MMEYRIAMQREIRSHRPGFTLIELVIAISLTAIISLGLMSALTLSLRAIPESDDAGIVAARIDNASEFLLADIMLASVVDVTDSSRKLDLIIPDTTGDGEADDIEYRFDNGQLTRKVNGGMKRQMVEGISAGQFGIAATDTRVSFVTVVFKTDQGQMHRLGVECLARPEIK